MKIRMRMRIRSYKVKISYKISHIFPWKELFKQISMISLSQAYQEVQKDRFMSLKGNQAIKSIIDTLEG